MTWWQHAFGWAAMALNVWGNIQLTGKGRAGWVTRFIVNLASIAYAIGLHGWALLANHVAFLGINAWGWWKWRPGAPDPMANEVRRLRRCLTDMEREFARAPRVVAAVRRALAD